jgi:hypothetical protein
VRSGTLAGAISAFVFTVVHYVAIRDIWFSLTALLVRPPSLDRGCGTTSRTS